jgi:hypothetical protein
MCPKPAIQIVGGTLDYRHPGCAASFVLDSVASLVHLSVWRAVNLGQGEACEVSVEEGYRFMVGHG